MEETDGVIGTGFIGTPALLPAMTRLGMLDLAEKTFLNRKVPGWLYQVERGATSIWERWDALAEDGTIYDPDMNSYNHYAYGAVCQWLFEDVAGIRPLEDKPGFEEIAFDPAILPGLSPVSAWHDTRFGRIQAGWSIDERGEVTCRLTLPEGVTARLEGSAGRKSLAADGIAVASGQKIVLGKGEHTITFVM